jgi:hypothetical protein
MTTLTRDQLNLRLRNGDHLELRREATAVNLEFFARRLNNLMVQNGYKIERYSAELQ